MEGNIVKAAWILGGSIFASTILFGGGLLVLGFYVANSTSKQMDEASRRTATAMIEAAKNTTVHFDDTTMVKVGFEPKLPVAMRIENSMDENRGTRAMFEVEVTPRAAK